MIRLTTRLSHSRAGVVLREPVAPNPLQPERDNDKFVLLPQNARRRYETLVQKQEHLRDISESSQLNEVSLSAGNRTLGVVAFGIAYNYVMEVVKRHGLDISVCKVSQYPPPRNRLRHFIDAHETVLIAEDGYPVYEELIRGFFDSPKFLGRMDGALPRTGELNPDVVAAALSCGAAVTFETAAVVPKRPPQLCKGCSHRDLFAALSKALSDSPERRVFSDIGCYTLGALPPFSCIHSCVDMGASVTMAKGAADAGLRPAVAVIGDSTFAHSGMTGLLDAVNDRSPVTVVISDNLTTAMTGGQASSATGRLAEICRGLGVAEAHVRTIVPLEKHLKENVRALREEFAYNDVSVVIASRECVQFAKKKKSAGRSD